jgi:hypothetical protein
MINLIKEFIDKFFGGGFPPPSLEGILLHIGSKVMGHCLSKIIDYVIEKFREDS